MRSQLMLTPFFFNRFGLFESFYVLKCHMYLFYKSSKSHYIEKSRIVFITFSSVDRDDFNFFFIKQKPSVKLTGISIVKLKWNHEFCMNGFERRWRRKNCKNRSNFTYRKKAIISDRWVDFKTFLSCQIFTANVRKENNKMHEWLIMRQSRNFEIPPWTTTQSWSCGLLVRQWKVSEGKFIQFPKSNYFFMIRIEMKLDQRIESDFSYQWAFTFCVSILYLI